MSARPELAYRQQFTQALLARAADAHPANLAPHEARRFRVYRNNVHTALITALADAYPVIQRLVGEEFFAAMAREFFLLEHERESTLALYGADFADFIEQFTPAASLPYLADVARLERARLEALHAADAAVIDASALPTDGEQLLNMTFEPHPALRLLSSAHPVVSIWLANQADEPQNIITASAEFALITRPRFVVNTLLLDQATGRFTRQLMQGHTLQQAYTNTSSIAGEFDIGVAFSQLLEAGAFTDAATYQEDTK